MKKFYLAFLVLSCLVAFTTSCLASGEANNPRLINVSGEAEMHVQPDEVILTLGVETLNKDMDLAKQSNDDRIKKIINLAIGLGIEPKYIQTDNITIQPRYENNNPKTNFSGFVIRKNIVFTIKDISKFENLLSSSLTAGANYVMGIQFRSTEIRKYRDQARKLAIKAAHEKALILAGELGQKVGVPYSITEQTNNRLPGMSYYNSPQLQNVIQNYDGAGQPEVEALAPGQISIRATVLVSFELINLI